MLNIDKQIQRYNVKVVIINLKNMKKLIFILLLCVAVPTLASAQIVGGASVYTNATTNISGNQATLQGQLSMPYFGGYNEVWFQWGQTTNYGYETSHQPQYGSGSFNQVIVNLPSNTTIHARAVAQVSGGLIYGQDIAFYTSNSSYFGGGTLTVSKRVMNITSGNLAWFPSVNANPYDILGFAITLQANNQNVHNVTVSDILPSYLINQQGVMINTNQYYNGNNTSQINVGTVYVGQPIVVSYRAQVAPDSNFSYEMTTITNNASITSSETGTQTASASVIVNKSGVSGVTIVSTGITNGLVSDSFILPLLMIVFGMWLYFSGNANKFADKLKLVLKK